MKNDLHTGAADWVVGAVKNNPEGLLLLAAGCALLLRRASSGQGNRVSTRLPSYSDDWPERRSGEGRISRAADSVREYASDMRDAVSETASSSADAVSDFAKDAGRTIVSRSEDLTDQARETFQTTRDRVLENQPLAVALAGLAAGAAVAAALPATAIERRTLGPAGEQLSHAVARTGRQVKKAASAAGERLMSAAEERGLSADGLKEMADDVAGAFDKAMTEGDRSPSSSSSSSSSRSSGSMPSANSDMSGSSGAGKAKFGQKS